LIIFFVRPFLLPPEGGFSPPDRALGPWFKTTGFQPYSLSAGGSVRQFFMPPAFSWWLFTFITRLKSPAFSRSALAALFLAMFDALPKYAKQGFQPCERTVCGLSVLCDPREPTYFH
jgi:hypothetical protein